MKNDKGYTQLYSAGSQGLGSVKIIYKKNIFSIAKFWKQVFLIQEIYHNIRKALWLDFRFQFAFLGGIESKIFIGAGYDMTDLIPALYTHILSPLFQPILDQNFSVLNKA